MMRQREESDFCRYICYSVTHRDNKELYVEEKDSQEKMCRQRTTHTVLKVSLGSKDRLTPQKTKHCPGQYKQKHHREVGMKGGGV